MAAACVAALGLSACGAFGIYQDFPEPAKPSGPLTLNLVPVEFSDVPGWRTDKLIDAMPAFLASCRAIASQPPERRLGPLDEHGRMADLQAICRDIQTVDIREPVFLRSFLENRFRPYLVQSRQDLLDVVTRDPDAGKITGYYEAIVRASWQPDQRYRYPVYRRPGDIIAIDLGKFDPELDGRLFAARKDGPNTVAPYFTREEINNGSLQGRQLEILYVDSLVDLFFMHVQGSGRALLPDGSYVRLAFSGRNGHRYTSIGRELVAEGALKLKDVSLQSIRAWLRQNPLAAPGIMNRNKSYIFFRVEEDDAVKGAQGIPLTPGRSVAVDRAFTPLGSLLFLDTLEPLPPEDETFIEGLRREGRKAPLRVLVVAQDVGSAIKGPQRIDMYWGGGELAEARAGVMNESVRVYRLLPKK